MNFFKEARQIQKGTDLIITGYPSKKGGLPFTNRGQLVKIRPGRVGNYLAEYTIHTVKGMSGSPVEADMYSKEIEEDEETFIQPGNNTIAIHTGCNEADNTNYGTLVTEKLLEWRQLTLDSYLPRYEEI